MSACADYQDCPSVFGISCNFGNSCGNGTCTPSERCSGTCPADCGTLPLTETNCTDGIDNDCNGTADCSDAPCFAACCGNGTCDPAESSCNCTADCGLPLSFEAQCSDARDNDCDGLIDCADPECQVGSETNCTDGLDDDCDGAIDCADTECQSIDADNDGYTHALCGGPDCDDSDSLINPGAVENCTDGIDSDCDGVDGCADDDCAIDADGDGVPIPPCGNDCDDTDDTVAPGFLEICDDGVDNDCDTVVDCADSYCVGDPACCGDGTCDSIEGQFCTCALDCGNPTASEVGLCFDGRDNDCDGEVDCNDWDCCSTQSACQAPFGCGDGSCDFQQGENRCTCQCDCGPPPATETSCSGNQDEDCDGLTDCNDADCNGADNDGDGYAGICGGPDCDDFDPNRNPGEPENCTDGIDNDCDFADCADSDCHGDPNCRACCYTPGCLTLSSAQAGLCSLQNGVLGAAGTFCQGAAACCGSDGSCVDGDTFCCTSAGDTPLGVGTSCSTLPVAEAVCDDGLDNDCDADIDCDDGDCAESTSCAAAPPDIVWDSDSLSLDRTTRALRFRLDPPATATGPDDQSAIKVTMVDLQHPVPANLASKPPKDFTTFDTRLNGVCSGGSLPGHHCDDDGDCGGGTCSSLAACTATGNTAAWSAGEDTTPDAAGGFQGGCARWVGRPGTFMESQGPPASGPFRAARLQCTPFYFDWVTETAGGTIAVVGAEIAPSSEYSVQAFGSSCKGAEDGCSDVSPAVTMFTRRFGDAASPWVPPNPSGQPNSIDVAQLVAKFKGATTASLVKAVTQLQPNLPELNADVGALDIVAAVDAVKELAYAISGPCPCPSQATCNALACATPGTCTGSALPGLGTGAMCVKTCTGGANGGEPCINNTHCDSGTCGAGFCRDRCGRCK